MGVSGQPEAGSTHLSPPLRLMRTEITGHRRWRAGCLSTFREVLRHTHHYRRNPPIKLICRDSVKVYGMYLAKNLPFIRLFLFDQLTDKKAVPPARFRPHHQELSANRIQKWHLTRFLCLLLPKPAENEQTSGKNASQHHEGLTSQAKAIPCAHGIQVCSARALCSNPFRRINGNACELFSGCVA
jgi:hypothetical protein